MKELYIRKGNLESNQYILIIGEESVLGGRDSAYRAKGTLHENYLVKKDPFSGAENLMYIHACENILLDSDLYSRDYDIHKFLKTYCKDLLKWDGESNQGITESREAFLVKNGNVSQTVFTIRKRILSLVNPDGLFENARSTHIYLKTHRKANKKRYYFNKRKYKKIWKVKFFVFVFIFASAFYFVRKAIVNYELQKGYYTDSNYDFRNKMSDENDEWLFDKCLHILCEQGGKAEWLDEAYYSKRFNKSESYQVHFYDDYTVIRIKRGLNENQEQNAIAKACNEVLQNHLTSQ